MADFDEFYADYPRKMARKDAERAWGKLTEQERDRAATALPVHIQYWAQCATTKEFIPYPASWLNGARYDDEIEAPQIPEKVVAWWASDNGIITKGRELSLHPKGGESMNQFKARVVEAARKAA